MPKLVPLTDNMQPVISKWRKRKGQLETEIRIAKAEGNRRAEVNAEETIKEERPYVKGGEEICSRCDFIALVCTGRAPVTSVTQGEYHYRCLACSYEVDLDDN